MSLRRVRLVAAMTLAMLLLVVPAAAGAGTSESASAHAMTEGSLAIRIDGFPVAFDPAPYTVPPGRTMVPMRAFFEALGADVKWDEVRREVTGTRGNVSVQLTIGSRQAYLNGHPVLLDVAPEIRHDRTFIPLRFVAESLDGFVNYHASTREIFVVSKNPKPAGIALEKGLQVRFRVMLANLFLNNQWHLTVEQVSKFPGPLTYMFEGRVGNQAVPLVHRTLQTLEDGAKFLPTMLAADESETAPWLSQRVFGDLKIYGKAEGFVTGGLGRNSQSPTTLSLVNRSTLVFTMEGGRVQAAVLEAITASGDRFWILDDAANPLVLKFFPVGIPLPGAFGTIGYQVEWVGYSE